MKKILVVGDVIEDVIVIPKGAVRINTDTPARIQKTMGGSAANVASWLAYLDCEVSFAASVGTEDQFLIQQQLRISGIETQLQAGSLPTGSIVVMVEGDSRTMLTDRGANQELQLAEIDPHGFAIVYLSGYALLGREPSELEVFFRRVRAADALLAIDPGSYGFIEDYGVENFRSLMLSCDIAFPNQQEEDLLELSGKIPLTVITKSEQGAVVNFESGASVSASGPLVELIDPTGAGDAFCAGFLAKLLELPHGLELEAEAVSTALEAGVKLGAMAVSQVGARPVSLSN